jgi:alpha-galactosidase
MIDSSVVESAMIELDKSKALSKGTRCMRLRTAAIVSLLMALFMPVEISAQKDEVEFGNGRVRLRVASQSKQWWTFQREQGGTSLAFSGPVVEIDGAPVEDTLSGLKQPDTPRQLPNGASEYRVEAVYTHHPTLNVVLIFRLTADSPIVRFRYEIGSTGPQKVTRATGADRLEYFGVSLAGLPNVREVRFSEFQEATHSFALSERVVQQKEFDNGVRLMGPLVAASNGTVSAVVAYEHGSQVPDSFLEFRLTRERRTVLAAVKGNCVDGQALPYRTVWMEAGIVAGDIEALANSYRHFVLRGLSVNAESRKPYIFYNTWNFQERNKWWNHRPYLESMNEERMLQEIEVAHRMGIDVFVLDTGWYEKTGDWTVSVKRFPRGLGPIQEKLNAYGMRLGLWFDPGAAALSSAMLSEHRDTVVSWQGKEGRPKEIWETEASHRLCLVSRYADAFADTLIRMARETGARYFKWDAIGQYGCDSPNHNHGTAANTAQERANSYAFQLPMYMLRIVERVQASVPDAIIDFDITEGGRAVGLSFLSGGKYFLINNGPYKFNYDLPVDRERENWNLFFWPGAARTWICRTPLTFDKWIPSVLFLTHYFPDDPKASQMVNLGSLILGQNGIWGDLPSVSAEGVALIGETLKHYKQVREDITAASPVRSGGVGGTPEIHEKIADTGKGALVLFATSPGEFSYVTNARVVKQYWATGGPETKVEVSFDAQGRARVKASLNKPGTAIVLFGASAPIESR